MRPIRRLGWLVAGLGILVGSTGCGDRRPVVAYGEFLRSLVHPDRMARLDVPGSTLASTFDPSGGNDDYNNFAGKGPDGWAVLADLKGPGYVSRFWTTGGTDTKQRLRFYFDGEREARIDTTVGDLQAGKVPGLLPPLCRYEQSCWWCYVPLTFNKSLKVMASAENFTHQGFPRLFFQLNWARMPEGRPVETFPKTLTPEHLAALRDFGAFWEGAAHVEGSARKEDERRGSGTIQVDPGERKAFEAVAGPGVLRELSFELTATDGKAEVWSRDVMVRITWDDAAQPSVVVPLGPLCGDLWFSPSFQSRFFGVSNDVYSLRFPMPFRKSARIEIENLGGAGVTLGGQWVVTADPVPSSGEPGPVTGYFHACWSRSSPNDVGRPHSVLQAQGRGKYAGCLLGVINFDKSWWLLEGDETIAMDGAATPQWRGTGLEDYFNSAWYYKNNLARPLHGLVFKAPFRTVQYRIHTDDAPTFATAVDVRIERGPDQASHGLMESVAFYYLDKPSGARSVDATAECRALPTDPLEQGTVMLDLANYDRFGDYERASRYIARFLARYPAIPFAPILRLRQLACREKLQGIEAVRPLYRQFIATEQDAAAVKYAELLLWFHESPTNALLSLFCSNQARAFVDDKVVSEVNDPRMFAVVPVTVAPGAHVLGVESRRNQYPEWVQACLRTHRGDVVTDSSWQFEYRPAGDEWKKAGFDAKAWPYTGNSMVEGPPIPPHIWTSPHPFVDMQAKPLGIWVSTEWPANKSVAVFRKEFELR